MDNQMRKWQEEEFLPWKQAAEQYQNEKQRMTDKLRQNAAELKYIISLLLDQREREAVRAWNQLDLEPALQDIRLNLNRGTIEMILFNGERAMLNIDQMLNDLKKVMD